MPLDVADLYGTSTTSAWVSWTTTSATSCLAWSSWTTVGPALVDDAPRQRARQLLKANLSLEQTRQLEERGWFEVHGSKGTRYQVWQGQVRNVLQCDDSGRIIGRFCAHPAEAVPDEDAMLAQKLLLETDEAAFLAIANRS